jgi:hypothetical protein
MESLKGPLFYVYVVMLIAAKVSFIVQFSEIPLVFAFFYISQIILAITIVINSVLLTKDDE